MNFDPETGRLSLWLPLPPSANRLFRTGFGAGYATKPYQEWLSGAHESLTALLDGEWQHDTYRWWQVLVIVDLPVHPQPDPHNLLKALLDALTGHRPAGKSDVSLETGERIALGKILPGPGLWDDDKRVMVICSVRSLNHPNPGVEIHAQPLPRELWPVDVRARDADLAKQAKAEAREQVRRERAERELLLKRVRDEKKARRP